jgi:hypothetical protein
MNFSEMLDAANSENQQKLYEVTALGLDADRIPDEWELDEAEYDRINKFVSAPPKKSFPRDMDNLSFSETLAAAEKYQNDNQSKLYANMHSDELVQTGFLGQDNFLNAQDVAEVTAPIEDAAHRWGNGPKPAAAYSFSEALTAMNGEPQNVQLGWMDDDNFLTQRENNGIVAPYLHMSTYVDKVDGFHQQ